MTLPLTDDETAAPRRRVEQESRSTQEVARQAVRETAITADVAS